MVANKRKSRKRAGNLDIWLTQLIVDQPVVMRIANLQKTVATVFTGVLVGEPISLWSPVSVYDPLEIQLCTLQTLLTNETQEYNWYVKAVITGTIPTLAGTRFFLKDTGEKLRPTIENAIAVLEMQSQIEKLKEMKYAEAPF